MLHLFHLPEEPDDGLLLSWKLERQDLMMSRHPPTSAIELVHLIVVSTVIFLGLPYNSRCQGSKTPGVEEIDSNVHRVTHF